MYDPTETKYQRKRRAKYREKRTNYRKKKRTRKEPTPRQNKTIFPFRRQRVVLLTTRMMKKQILKFNTYKMKTLCLQNSSFYDNFSKLTENSVFLCIFSSFSCNIVVFCSFFTNFLVFYYHNGYHLYYFYCLLFVQLYYF